MIPMIPDNLRQPLWPHIESVYLDGDPVRLRYCFGFFLKRDEPPTACGPEFDCSNCLALINPCLFGRRYQAEDISGPVRYIPKGSCLNRYGPLFE